MDYFSPIEDPRHTPGKRHGYAKELSSSSSSQGFSSTKQKSLFTNFITTPPVAKPQCYFPSIGYVTEASKFYYGKQQPELISESVPTLYPSEKSAFTKYKNLLPEQSAVYEDPPPIAATLTSDDGILKPQPRYATPVIDSGVNSTVAFRSAQYSTNSNGDVTQIMGVDIVRGQSSPTQQVVLTNGSEPGHRETPSPATKGPENQLRQKNFKNILNSFQMASDRALQQQRERYRYITNGYESDQGFYAQNSGRSSEAAFSDDCRLRKNKQNHLRALTISIPAVGNNATQAGRWSMKVNGAYVDVEPASPTISALSSIPPSPPISSSQQSPNSSTFPKDYNQLMPKKQRIFEDGRFERHELMRQRRYARSMSRTRPVSDIETETRRPSGPPSASQSYVIRCSSMESYSTLKTISSSRTSSRSPPLPPSEPRSPSSEGEDDDSASVVGLYKQVKSIIHSLAKHQWLYRLDFIGGSDGKAVTSPRFPRRFPAMLRHYPAVATPNRDEMIGNHLELLEYASAHLGKFFRNRDLIVSKTSLHKLKLNDLIFESLAPAFSKCSTHFFEAFLPHSGFLSTAICLMAEPIPRQYTGPVKLSFSDGNIWNPPTIIEIKAQRDEERQILRRLPRYRSTLKYRFLIIPRYSLSTINSLAADHLHIDVDESYERKLCFILLQLVCALKSLQLNGVETVSDDFSEFILLYRNARAGPDAAAIDQLPRILLLQESLKTRSKKPTIGLCEYGLKALTTMLNLNSSDPLTDFSSLVQTSFSYSLMECAKALQQDKSSSLTDAKNALEFGMFVGQDASSFKSEEDAQAWIDSQRADYVNYLFREVIDGSFRLNEVYEQLRLQFLLSAAPRTLLNLLKNMRP